MAKLSILSVTAWPEQSDCAHRYDVTGMVGELLVGQCPWCGLHFALVPEDELEEATAGLLESLGDAVTGVTRFRPTGG